MWKNNDRIIDSVLIVLNCSMARDNGRLHCIVGVTHLLQAQSSHLFLPPGGTGPYRFGFIVKEIPLLKTSPAPPKKKKTKTNKTFFILDLDS